ncbi:hypothetical protein PO909_006990 [Leuciscus waleckii]
MRAGAITLMPPKVQLNNTAEERQESQWGNKSQAVAQNECAQVDRCTEVMQKFADWGCCPEAEWCQHGFSFINLYIITVYGSPSPSGLTVVLSSLDFKAPAVS